MLPSPCSTTNGSINISARSLGGFNVQLVMEAIGGGGHMTMAGAQLPRATMEEAQERLIEAIDRQIADQGAFPGRSGACRINRVFRFLNSRKG